MPCRAAGCPTSRPCGLCTAGASAVEAASRPDAPTDAQVAAMHRPVGESFMPAAYAQEES